MSMFIAIWSSMIGASASEVQSVELPDGNYIVDGSGKYITDGSGKYIVDGS